MDINFLLLNVKMGRLWKGIFSKKQKILDIGCGDNPGYHRHIHASVVCADKSPSRAAHLLSDAQSLPFKPASFDGVVSVNSLYYCERPSSAVAEFSRALRKGGKLVMVTPFLYPIHDIPHDKYRFTEHGLKEMLKDKFAIEKIVPIGGVFSIPALLLHSLHKGVVSASPRWMRPAANVVMFLILLIPSIMGQLISILDFLDWTRRWPVYYFTIARKK